MDGTTRQDRVKMVAYGVLVVIVALAVLNFVFDVAAAATAFEATIPLIYLFFAYQALFVHGSAEEPLALAAAVGLTVAALTDWYALVAGEGPVTNAGRVVSILGLGAYLWLVVKRGRADSAEEDLLDWEEEDQNR